MAARKRSRRRLRPDTTFCDRRGWSAQIRCGLEGQDGTRCPLDKRTAVRATLRVHAGIGWEGFISLSLRARSGALVGTLVATVLLSLATPWSVRAGTTVNLDQWASLDRAWQNGNLNGNNSRYPEGGVIPFRLAMEGLAVGNHSIHINYDWTAGGHKAHDFLATWNLTNASGKICTPSGGAISSMCPSLPAYSSFAFPPDPYVADGLSVTGAEVYSGAIRRLTIWGGTILSISKPVHSGSASGNSAADLLVRFHANGSAVLLAWGGHIAQSPYWTRAAAGPAAA